MMNGRPHDRAQPAGESAVMHGDLAPRAPRIRIDVPLGTPYREIRDSILRQAWELAGTQLRAAIALGITPETVSRTLLGCDIDSIEKPPEDMEGIEPGTITLSHDGRLEILKIALNADVSSPDHEEEKWLEEILD